MYAEEIGELEEQQVLCGAKRTEIIEGATRHVWKSVVCAHICIVGAYGYQRKYNYLTDGDYQGLSRDWWRCLTAA